MIELKSCPVCWGLKVICVGIKENLDPILAPCTGCDGYGWLAYKTKEVKMEQILLNDKETELARGATAQRYYELLETGQITNIEFVNRQGRAQNKAQLKKMVEWLVENYSENSDKSRWSGIIIWDEDEGWQALLKEVE